jgi:hypothetical protein
MATIETVHAARTELERIILSHITQFEKETGVYVESVDLTHEERIGENLPQTYGVKLDIRL